MRDYIKNTIATYNKYPNIYINNRRRLALLSEISEFVSLLPGKLILEAGSGPGRDARLFCDLGFNVTCVDLSKSFCKLGKIKAPKAKWLNMDILELDLPSQTFDGIWCCVVLSHFNREDIAIALDNLYKVLKPNGIMFIAIKSGNDEKEELEEEFHNSPRFISYFNKDEIIAYSEKAGLKVEKLYLINEKERFGPNERDLDIWSIFLRKTM